MQVIDPINLISTNQDGVAYIHGTRMKVSQIAAEATQLGYSPQQIQEAHEHLSLAQIHAALAYYYAHRAQIEAEIERRSRSVQEMQAKIRPVATRKELEARLRRSRPDHASFG